MAGDTTLHINRRYQGKDVKITISVMCAMNEGVQFRRNYPGACALYQSLHYILQ